MLENSSALAEFKKILDDHGFSVSALSCHGNPLHPDKAHRASNIAKSAVRPFCWPKNWVFR